MTLHEFYQQFLNGIRHITVPELVAVVAGIASVWFSRIENILVYPVGLISTTIYIWLSYEYHLLGEALVNVYYTIMSIYGWILWAKRNQQHEHAVVITSSSTKEWRNQLLFFAFFYITIFIALTYLKKGFASGAIPWADALASATAFTGMWLMARKKVESWYWWIITNIASIPLYFVKGLVFTSVFYFVLFIMAIFGLYEWGKRAKKAATNK